MRRINLSSTVASLLSITTLCTMSLVASSKAEAKTLYLNPGILETGNAKFAAYYFNSGQNGIWTSDYLPELNDGVFQADIPDGYSTVIFCRMNPNAALDWAGRWDQTEDLEIPSDKNLYTISSKKDNSNICLGSWSVYTPGSNPGGGGTPTDYGTAVPSECQDVMLQAFYWDSYEDKGYGVTNWENLIAQSDEIGTYFDLVWLPPSAKSSGGTGYHPKNYATQASRAWGSRANLFSLLSLLHNHGTRVLADIVINHADNNNTACNYEKYDFGRFGYFEPQSTWMTKNDEGVTSHGCTGGANNDDGQHEANYTAARDWDHLNENVQNMCKAYLKYMKDSIGYDGWRYDYAGGFHVSHINDYNVASRPYFSVIEYWDGNAATLKTRIDQAGKNTLAFDFAAKYTAYRDGINGKAYSKLVNCGLRGQGYSKYAVNFIDNHDTFNRGNGNEPNGAGNGSSINNKSLMMRCNAYLLAMPGVPCVFWPHWVKYKDEIKAMINARKKAGIHSESSVEESSGSGWYKATVYGKYGNVILYLGSKATEAAPSGYKQAVKGSDYAMYYTGNGSAIEHVNVPAQNGEKFLKDGQLYIRCGEKIYDSQGRIVKFEK